MKAVVTQLDGMIGYISDENRRVYKFEWMRFIPDAFVGMEVDFYPNSDDDEWVHLISPVMETVQQKIALQINRIMSDMALLKTLLTEITYPTEEEMADMADELK